MAGAETTKGRGWRVMRWAGALALLSLPWMAMQFTTEVNWSGGDFAVFGIMLAAVCGSWELVARGRRGAAYRSAAALALTATFIELWVDLAVGVAGPPGVALNRLFVALPVLGIAGTVMVLGRAGGMAIVMRVIAMAQGAAGLAVAWTTAAHLGPVLGLSLAFTASWLVCAGLFARAARTNA